MDEHIFESGKHDITSEHAVLIPALSSVKSLMAYVEAVAVVIGSCHIHSVYEDRGNIKIYLKDKRFVDILVNNGVSIVGHQINVDYAVPRADKIILSNVDPIVPDSILMKLLCYYGNPVSAIIHEKIAINTEYSHIECGKRKVYMEIFSGKKIPAKINFTYQNMYFRIDVSIESKAANGNETVSALAAYEEQIEDSNDIVEIENADTVKSDIEEIKPKKKPTAKQLAYHLRGSSKANSAANMARRLKKRARKGWFGKKNTMASQRFTKKNKGRLRIAVKKHLADESKKKSKVAGSEMKTEASSHTNSIIEDNPNSSSIFEVSDRNSADTSDISQLVTQYPLNTNELLEFMKKTRFHRDPCQIAWEFLSEKTPESIEALKIQLREYHQVTKEGGLKFRLRRIMASLKYPDDTIDE